MIRDCTCPAPQHHPSPLQPDSCVRCGRFINPAWTSNDQTVAEFYDRLERSTPVVSPSFHAFRRHAEERERTGRTRFQHNFHRRDNPAEALEEAADGANYAMFDVLKARRRGDLDDVDVALKAAQKFAEAYDALLELRAKRDGAP